MTLQRDSRRALSLIEVLFVITLIGLVMTLAVPKMNKIFRASVQSSVRRFASLVRFTYDQAVLTGKVHRIVLDLDKQQWMIQSADPGSLPIDELKSQYSREYTYKPKEDEFDTLTQKDTQRIPKGVRLVEASSWRIGKEGISKGVVSIYAFPSGFIDEASVVLSESNTQSKQKFRVSTKSLTGRIQVEVINE